MLTEIHYIKKITLCFINDEHTSCYINEIMSHYTNEIALHYVSGIMLHYQNCHKVDELHYIT